MASPPVALRNLLRIKRPPPTLPFHPVTVLLLLVFAAYSRKFFFCPLSCVFLHLRLSFQVPSPPLPPAHRNKRTGPRAGPPFFCSRVLFPLLDARLFFPVHWLKGRAFDTDLQSQNCLTRLRLARVPRLPLLLGSHLLRFERR